MLLASADADFNSDFYFAAATVIPIFLILTLLQLGLLRAAVEENLDWSIAPTSLFQRLTFRGTRLYLLAAALVFQACSAEGWAVFCLWLRNDSVVSDGYVLVSVVALLLSAVLLLSSSWVWQRDRLRRAQLERVKLAEREHAALRKPIRLR